MDLSVGSMTDVGCVRELNEDAVLTTPDLFVVADGMGGHAAGEVASALVLKHLGTLTGRDDLRPDDVIAGILAANAEILDVAAERVETAGMGTTVTGVCLGTVGGSPHWFIFNVGDSRTYRFADDILTQVSVDHSEVEELVEAGRITPEQARIHPRRNVITRSLGSDPAPVPDMWVLPTTPGERFLICSDGLTGEVDDRAIAATLRANPCPQQCVEALVEMALQAGGHDNVSVIVLALAGADAGSQAEVTAPRSGLAEVSE